MSHNLRESLMYDCNYNLFLVKTMLPNVRNVQDRQTAVRWLRFLKNCAKSIDEMRLRNDFMYYLVLNVQEGVLKAPFNKPPPNAPLMSIASLLPGTTDILEEGDTSNEKFGKIDQTASGVAGIPKKSQIMQRSPDGGEFLASQPIPDVGAFCYMAVITKKRN
ncbi:uncharacterized protein LOC107271944 [Cephus cinctus]|uniref:Uncharacterized protein LOC107271944 n=1 Tax=Cephus cinctus TaxID=211228 RepID=A0AAJ7W5V6_CEPCN|nr:uncharacterized protein LOC107271944 [Cephus cinctus]